MAAVTYGNAKKADFVAVNKSRATSLEVKTTSEAKWVLGGILPDDTESIWVLVHLPSNDAAAPEYYVLTSSELRKVVLPQHELYNARYREKHGKEYSGKGIVSVQRTLIEDKHRGAWHKIARAVGI